MSNGIYECQHGGFFLFRFGKVITLQEQCDDAQGPIFVNIYEVWVVVVLCMGVQHIPHVWLKQQIHNLPVNIAPQIHSSTECFILYTPAYNGD